jgi:nitrite reductase/ring-hydroxylating ferredoxin subunit
LSDKFVRAISADAIAPGGMKTVELDGNEIVVCNCGGTYYAVQRRCGHMNAPLELGTLDGTYLTCPMHCAQFDVTSGEAISGPVTADLGHEALPPRPGAYMQNIGMLMKNVRTESMRAYRTRLEAGWVEIALCVGAPGRLAEAGGTSKVVLKI